MGDITRSGSGKGTQRYKDPPSPIGSENWTIWDAQLPPDHIARRIVGVLRYLDLGPLRESYSGRGSPPHPPELMLAMALVEKYEGNCSPSEWYRHQSDRISLLWIGQGICPARSVWYEFRDRVGRFLDQWHEQIMKLAQDAKMTSAMDGVIDGTLIAASASKLQLLNGKQLDSRLQHLAEAIQCDEQQIPLGQRLQWMARTPRGRRLQQSRCRRAVQFLQHRLDKNSRKTPSERLDPDRIVISVTDPEAALGPDKSKIFRPLYNSLFVTDRDSPMILGYAVYAHGQDTPLLGPTLKRTAASIGHGLRRLTGDAGFVSGRNLEMCRSQGVELIGPWKVNDFSKPKPNKFYDKDQFVWHSRDHEYECPAHQRLKLFGTEIRRRSDQQNERLERFTTAAGVCAACLLRTACTQSKTGRQLRRGEFEDLVVAHRAKMETPQAKALMQARGQIAERQFADLKEHRRLRRHTGRGLSRVTVDIGLAVMLHNLISIDKQLRPEIPP